MIFLQNDKTLNDKHHRDGYYFLLFPNY